MTVADRIKEKRTELNMSQTELAKKAGWSDKTSISKIESAGNEISLKKLTRISEALNVSVAYLMGWESDNNIELEIATNEENRLKRYAKYFGTFDKFTNLPDNKKEIIQNLIESLGE